MAKKKRFYLHIFSVCVNLLYLNYSLIKICVWIFGLLLFVFIHKFVSTFLDWKYRAACSRSWLSLVIATDNQLLFSSV